MKKHEFLTREVLRKLQEEGPVISKIGKIRLELLHIVFIHCGKKLYTLAKSDFMNNELYLITVDEEFEHPESGFLDS
jgi:hypothetical protein